METMVNKKKLNCFQHSEFTKKLNNKELQDLKEQPELIENLEEFRARLNILRFLLGMPITINSWYRDAEHNKRENGEPTSQHLTGAAVDITCRNNRQLLEVINKTITQWGVEYGQIIVYGKINIRFIHISLPTSKHINQYLQYE